MSPAVGGALALALLLGGCDGGTEPAPTAPTEAQRLVGTWTTRGQDPDLGDVTVRMDLRADGSLRVVVSGAVGGGLAFAGTWALVGDRLHLVGAWFQPDGEVTVDWDLVGDDLVLRSEAGGSQTWRRQV